MCGCQCLSERESLTCKLRTVLFVARIVSFVRSFTANSFLCFISGLSSPSIWVQLSVCVRVCECMRSMSDSTPTHHLSKQIHCVRQYRVDVFVSCLRIYIFLSMEPFFRNCVRLCTYSLVLVFDKQQFDFNVGTFTHTSKRTLYVCIWMRTQNGTITLLCEYKISEEEKKWNFFRFFSDHRTHS